MRARTSLALIVLGAASLAAALILRPAGDTGPTGGGQLVFPSIAATLPKAMQVTIASAGKTTTLELKGQNWGLAERADYPVIDSKLRQLFAGLAELQLTEPRTADPSEYSKLGVEKPGPTGTSTLLTVRDGAGATIATLILGHRRVRSQGGLPEAVYIRRPDDAQSWLAEGAVPADADPQSWLVRDLTDIAPTRIVKVVATVGSDTLIFTRSGAKLALTPSGDVKLDDYKLDEIAGALSSLTMTDVQKGDLPGTKLGSSVFTTDDGLEITVTLSKQDKLLWASFSATGKGAEALKKLEGWAYQLSDWRQTSLLPTLADIKAAEPEKPATPAQATPEPPK
jgi:hypothetical protein